MSQKTPSSKRILNTPAKKFFATQIAYCTAIDKESNELYSGDEWLYHGLQKSPMSFTQVWVQGVVVLVSADGNDVLIDDGTGIIHVTGVVKLVKNVNISKGMYVMVAGKLLTTGQSLSQNNSSSSYPSIRMLKFADKTTNVSSETLWMLEVIDAQRNENNDSNIFLTVH